MFRRTSRKATLPFLTTLAALNLVAAPVFAQAPTVVPAPITAPATPIAASSSIAALLPKNTTGLFLINTNESRWQELRKFGLFPKDFSFPSFFYLTEKQVDFNRDVRPWLGDQIGYAWLPSRGAVTIASVNNAEPISQYIEAVKSSRTKPVNEQQYKGITILQWEPEPEPVKPDESEPKEPAKPPTGENKKPRKKQPANQTKGLLSQLEIAKAPNTPEVSSDVESKNQTPSSEAVLKPQPLVIAVLPKHVVSSNSVEAIQQVIDAQIIDTQTGEQLSSDPKFQQVVQNPRYAKSLFVGYGKYVELMKSLNEENRRQSEQLRGRLPSTIPDPFLLSPEKLDPLNDFYDTIDAYIWAEQDGLHVQFGLDFKQAIPEEWIAGFTTKNEILTQLPEVSYMMGNSQNLSLYWRILMLALESQSSIKAQLDQFRENSRNLVGVDDRDLFPWMTGEYAMFMYPTRKGFLPEMNVDLGIGLMVDTNDRPAANAALSKLNQFLKPRLGQALFHERKLSGEPVVELGGIQNGKRIDFMSYGWVDSDSLLILGGGGSLNDFSPKPKSSLAQSANFKAAIAPLKNSNMGYLYINGGAVMTLVNNSILPLFLGKEVSSSPFLDEIKASLASIRSISASGSLTPTRSESRGFMALAITRKQADEQVSNASEFLQIGDRQFGEGDEAGAIQNYTRAIELDPNNAIAYAVRGDAQVMQKNYGAAIEDYTQALRLDPKNAQNYHSRGRAKSSTADYRAALEDFNQAIALDQTNPAFYSMRARIRLALEDYPNAIADAETALKLEPYMRDAHSTKCYARARGLKDFTGALTDCNQAIGEPEQVGSSEYLGKRCYVRANLRDQNALEDCDRAMQLTREFPEQEPSVFENRGLAKAALGNRSEALDDLRKASELFEQQKDSHSQQRIEKVIRSMD
jgi:tetratricopeptide (TPR) repeat protein